MANPGVDALPDQVSFQLGDRRDYREKRLPQRTARIDIFLVADELNAQRAELLQRQQQVLGASCKAVEAPDDDGVELPLTRVGYQAIQLWPRVFGAGFAYVDVFSKDFEFPRRAVSSQIAELEIAALVFSAHAGVNRNSHSLDLRSRGSGGQDGGLNGPFLNQEEASPIVLILPGQFHRFRPPFLKQRRSGVRLSQMAQIAICVWITDKDKIISKQCLGIPDYKERRQTSPLTQVRNFARSRVQVLARHML